MEENLETIKVIEKEDLNEMNVNDLVDLKIDIDNMLDEVSELIAKCDDIIEGEV